MRQTTLIKTQEQIDKSDHEKNWENWKTYYDLLVKTTDGQVLWKIGYGNWEYDTNKTDGNKWDEKFYLTTKTHVT